MSTDLVISPQISNYYPFQFVPFTVLGGGAVTCQNELPNTIFMITNIDISSHDSTVNCQMAIEDENGKVFFADSVFLDVAATIYFSWRGLRYMGYGGQITVQQFTVVEAPSLDVTISGWVVEPPLFTLEHV